MNSVTTDTPDDEWTVDQLGRITDLPVRTIREYQSIGLLPHPRRSGRVGIYNASHRRRLELIGRLQARGYSLAGIGDLLSAWHGGDALGDLLGLTPDELVHIDEPGAAVSAEHLRTLLPGIAPEHLDALLATGVVEACGTDQYCIPSPSLLQLAVDSLAAGLDADTVLRLLQQLRLAADTVTEAAVEALRRLPESIDDEDLRRFATRGRGLLSHGIGRLSLHRLGHRLAADDTVDLADDLRGSMR